MKIVVYFNSMAPAGGIERVIAKHINFLISQKHDIILITKDDGTSFYSIPTSVKRESIRIDMDFNMHNRLKRIFKIATTLIKTVTNLRKTIKKNNPDIIYVVHPLCLLEIYLSRINCKKILVTEHTSLNAYNKIYRIILNILYPKVGLLTVPTTEDSNIYNSLGIKNVYLPNPLPFYPNSQSSLQNKLALNVGRFTSDKRHELLINLWAKSKAKDFGWKLKIIGKGENNEKINSLVKHLHLEDSIIISTVTPHIEKEYLNASLFLLTSKNEGFGLVLAEAMACGVPCLAFNCPSGPKDIITNMVNGFLIEEGEHQMFVNRLDELIENEDLRKKLGTKARMDIKKFDENIVSDKLNELVLSHFS